MSSYQGEVGKLNNGWGPKKKGLMALLTYFILPFIPYRYEQS